MKNQKLFFISFLIVWVILILANFFGPKIAFSEQENRYLAKRPSFQLESLLNGEYAENLDTYINDHFIFRKQWLKIKSSMELLLGKKENNHVYIGKEGYLFEKFIYTKENEENLKKAVAIMEQLAQETNLPTYFMFVPNSIFVNSDKLPEQVQIANQEKIIDNVYQSCREVIPVDVTQILKAHKEENLYFKTDHHMTSTGAYYTYAAFCITKNQTPKSLFSFKPTLVSNDFLGTFDSKAQIANQEKDEIWIYQNPTIVEGYYDEEKWNSIYNEAYLSKKDQYSYFLNGNHAKVVLKTKVKNGQKLLIIKDSYAHNLAQFLCDDYEEIHFIDPRYYKDSISSYVKENQITQILFLYNVANLVKDIGIRNVR
ncbi:MAG: DHHW family protein [Clostridia bacterium]